MRDLLGLWVIVLIIGSGAMNLMAQNDPTTLQKIAVKTEQTNQWDYFLTEFLVTLLTLRAQNHALAFRYDEAIAAIDAAITLDPENPALYVERGQIVILLYEWDRVLDNYNTALELDPSYADAYFYRGILYYSILQREPALADFERYLELSPAGSHAVEAGRYAAGIRAEIEALNE